MNNKQFEQAVEQCWKGLRLWRSIWWLLIHGKQTFRIGYLLGRSDALWGETRPDWMIHAPEAKRLDLEYQKWCLRQ